MIEISTPISTEEISTPISTEEIRKLKCGDN